MDIILSWSDSDVNRIAVALLETDALTPADKYASSYIVDALDIEYLVRETLKFVNE